MITLLVKDLKLMLGKDKSLIGKIISIIITIVFVGCFVGLEVFLLTTILKKITKFPNADIAYINLFLFVISIIILITDLFNAKKLFFDEKDIEQLTVRPIENSAIICSKLLFLFITHYIISLLFVYPIICAYGALLSKNTSFFYLGLFYPLLSFFFEVGIALLIVYPTYMLGKFLKKHLIVQFILALIILFIGSFLYSKVLNVFISMVAANNINSLFTSDMIEKFIFLRKFEFPTNFLVDIFINKNYSKFFLYMGLSLGVFIIGVAVCIFAFNYVRNISIANKTKEIKETYKEKTVTKSLIKKEVTLLTKNSDYTLSFTGLLIVQPFLAYLVIKAINTIFLSGKFAYYLLALPNFIPLLDVLIIMLFSVIIASGANRYISMEKKTVKLLKTMPIDYKKQLGIKVLIPLSMSMLSLFITLLVLLISKTINVSTFGFGLLITMVLLIIFNIISLKEELCIRNRRPRSYLASNIYAYGLPIIYFVTTIVLSYFKMPIIYAYLIGLAAIIIVGVPYILYVRKHMKNFFLDLDVVN